MKKIIRLSKCFLFLFILLCFNSSVHAISTPTFTATATYNEEYEAIAVTVSYSGMDDLVPISGSPLRPTITGISKIAFSVTCDNPEIEFGGGESILPDVITSALEPRASFVNTANMKELLTNSSSELAVFYFAGSKDAVANFTITNPMIVVKEYETAVLKNTTEYRGDQITCIGCAYPPPVILANFIKLNEAIKMYEDIGKYSCYYDSYEETYSSTHIYYEEAKAVNQTEETNQDTVDKITKSLNEAIAKFAIKPIQAESIDIESKTDTLSGLKTYGVSAYFSPALKGAKRVVFNVRDGENKAKYVVSIAKGIACLDQHEWMGINLEIVYCPLESDLVIEDAYIDSLPCINRDPNKYNVDLYSTGDVCVILDEGTPVKKIQGDHTMVGIGVTAELRNELIFSSPLYVCYEGMNFTLSNGEKTRNVYWDFGTSISCDSSFGLQITDCPLDVDIEVIDVSPTTLKDLVLVPSLSSGAYFRTQYENIFDPEFAILDTDMLKSKTYNEIFN